MFPVSVDGQLLPWKRQMSWVAVLAPILIIARAIQGKATSTPQLRLAQKNHWRLSVRILRSDQVTRVRASPVKGGLLLVCSTIPMILPQSLSFNQGASTQRRPRHLAGTKERLPAPASLTESLSFCR